MNIIVKEALAALLRWQLCGLIQAAVWPGAFLALAALFGAPMGWALWGAAALAGAAYLFGVLAVGVLGDLVDYLKGELS